MSSLIDAFIFSTLAILLAAGVSFRFGILWTLPVGVVELTTITVGRASNTLTCHSKSWPGRLAAFTLDCRIICEGILHRDDESIHTARVVDRPQSHEVDKHRAILSVVCDLNMAIQPFGQAAYNRGDRLRLGLRPLRKRHDLPNTSCRVYPHIWVK